MPVLVKLFQKIKEEEGTLPKSFTRTTLP